MGKTLAQVSREDGIHPSFVVKWKKEYCKDPENAFSGNGRAYKWLRRSKTGQMNVIAGIDVRNEILRIAVEFPAYGYRRITAELRNRGYSVNHKRVLSLMREDNLLCVRKDFKSKTTDSRHNLRFYPNLMKGLKITQLDQVWASDITYIRLSGEFVYLTVIMDLFSRRCIGWNLDRSLHTELALKDVYNKKRLHSAIGCRFLIDFEKEVRASEVLSFKYCFLTLTSCILTRVHPNRSACSVKTFAQRKGVYQLAFSGFAF